MSRRIIAHAEGAPEAIGPYSAGVVWGALLLCAGQTPLVAATGELAGDEVAEQTRQCLRNLQAVCDAAGTRLDHALRLTIYVTDLGRFDEINEAYAEFFGPEPPARATVQVSALPKGAQVEIDALVAVP